MVVEVAALYMQTEPRVNTMEHLAATAARASSGGAFATTKHTAVGEFGHAKISASVQKTQNIL